MCIVVSLREKIMQSENKLFYWKIKRWIRRNTPVDTRLGIIIRFWETAHLPLPEANILP